MRMPENRLRDEIEGRLRDRLQVAVVSMEVAARDLERGAGRSDDEAAAAELRSIAAWLRRAAEAATRP